MVNVTSNVSNKQSAWKIFQILSKMGGWNENALWETINYLGVFAQLFGTQDKSKLYVQLYEIC